MRPFTSHRNHDTARSGYDVIVIGGGSAGSLIAGRLATEIDALKDLLEAEHSPGLAGDSDQGLADYARTTVFTMFHCAGTCRMGADDQSVVDPSLTVRGTNGLRVIDASIMPNLPSANTNAATLAIASKGLALLKPTSDAEGTRVS